MHCTVLQWVISAQCLVERGNVGKQMWRDTVICPKMNSGLRALLIYNPGHKPTCCVFLSVRDV